MTAAMSNLTFALTLASWAGCFWLGLQIGKGQSDLRRKREVEDLEYRFKIVNCEAVEASDAGDVFPRRG